MTGKIVLRDTGIYEMGQNGLTGEELLAELWLHYIF